ncbi:MAG: ribonuclease M5 [Deltaproteobacteria bacterium]|nr:ribonuclease M5 [Deltaproteobacteria bacterium]
MRIKQIIVVEGKDDERAVKQAVDAEVIITSGFGITGETFRKIEFARQKKGVIIFTDPDYVGEQIRRRINKKIKGCKNAYLSKKDACKNNNIGIENADPQPIKDALKKAKCIMENLSPMFTIKDLYENDFIGGSRAAKRREALGKILGIGYANGKQLLRRLNNYGISKEQFDHAVNALSEMEHGKREEELYRCACDVEADEALNKEMSDWEVTTGNGIEPETW